MLAKSHGLQFFACLVLALGPPCFPKQKLVQVLRRAGGCCTPHPDDIAILSIRGAFESRKQQGRRVEPKEGKVGHYREKQIWCPLFIKGLGLHLTCSVGIESPIFLYMYGLIYCARGNENLSLVK